MLGKYAPGDTIPWMQAPFWNRIFEVVGRPERWSQGEIITPAMAEVADSALEELINAWKAQGNKKGQEASAVGQSQG